MKKYPENLGCRYDYANKCDCSEDDKCGCDYPNNMPHNFSAGCFEENTQNENVHKREHTLQAATIGMPAPDFTAPALLSDNTMIEHFNFYKYTARHLSVLFFYPEDFSFTCPSELLMLNREMNAFSRRNVKILAVSTESVYSHLAWKELPPQKDGIADISFPLIADMDKKISSDYGILSKKQTARRATFIMDENRIIRHISINDDKIWRSPTEVIRIIDILNYKGDGLTDCPPGWKQNFPFERPQQESLTEIYTTHRDEN